MTARPSLAQSLLAAAVSAATLAAQAQQDDNASELPPALEEIVVTGTSLSRLRAIAQKHDDDRIIEALGVDELGQFPDRNVGESLNRLPGVSMLVEKGEGRFVQIRGINPALNNVTVNGVQLGSPEQEGGGRAAPMDVISGGILGGVQVVKTPTPDMDGQGIGGTVNVDTLMPFDREEPLYGRITTRLGYEDVRPEGEAFGGEDPRALDGLISGKFADNTVGWLLGASWSDREYVARGIYQDDWDQGSGVGLPVNVKNNYYIIGRERTNATAALEFRPDDFSRYYVRGFFASWDEFQHRNRYEQGLEEGVEPQGDNAGVSGPNRVAANIRQEEPEKDLMSFTAGGENTFDNLTASYMIQHNANELSEPNDYWEFRSGNDFGPNSWVKDGDGVVTITPDAGTPDRQDPNLIDFRRVRFFEREMEEDTNIAKLDLRWELEGERFVKTGIKYSGTDRTLDESRRRFNPGEQDLTLGSSADFTSGGFTNDLEDYSAPNIWMDYQAMNRFFSDPANAGYFEADPEDNFIADNSADYDVQEDIYAAYIMTGVTHGKLELIGGLRYEQTEIESSGNSLSDGIATGVTAQSEYRNFLPALIANYHFSDTLMLRAGITRALGRPDYDIIAPRSRINDDGGPVASVNVGNPDLEPRVSWNYDLALEWYPDPLSILSASIFYKDISDELVGTTESFDSRADMDAALDSLGLEGAVDTADLSRLDVSTTINGGSAYLEGVELLGQTQFGFLPGLFANFGVSASATFLDGETELPSGTIPLIGQPESSYAFSLFFQDERIDASLSYTYNDSFLTDLNDDSDLNLDQGEFGRWDGKISYSLNDRARLFVEALNINNEPTSEFQGGRDDWNTEYEWVGRTYFLGFSYGF